MKEPRIQRLHAWMQGYDITWEALGKQFGISGPGAKLMMRKETIPPERHVKLIELGFPTELLPEPFRARRGRPARQPRFPGLVAS